RSPSALWSKRRDPSGGVGRPLLRLDVAFEAGEEAFDARRPLPSDQQGVDELAQGTELQLVLHPLANEGRAALAGEPVTVSEPAQGERAGVKLERQRLVRPPIGDPFLEPASGPEVAPPFRAQTL